VSCRGEGVEGSRVFCSGGVVPSCCDVYGGWLLSACSGLGRWDLKSVPLCGWGLYSSVFCLWWEGFEGYGVCCVGEAFGHGDAALGVCQFAGVVRHVYSLEYLRLASHRGFGVGELDRQVV